MKRLWQHPGFALGFRDISTVGLGIAAWGLTTGVALVNGGLSTTEALAMTLLVFAGSAQLAALPLIMAGAPLWVIWVTAICVNLRFVVFSAHMRPYLSHLSRRRRLLYSYLLGDLSYVMFVKHYPHPSHDAQVQQAQEAYWLASIGGNWVYWISASLLGIALAQIIPVQWGLGFAGTLALLGVAASLATSPLRMTAAAVSGLAAIAAFAVPLRLNILVAIASAVALALMAEAVWARGQQTSGPAR
ncbi:MAG: hypothetical protein RLZZ397_623 [Pseudomonadota bacterium]